MLKNKKQLKLAASNVNVALDSQEKYIIYNCFIVLKIRITLSLYFKYNDYKNNNLGILSIKYIK